MYYLHGQASQIYIKAVDFFTVPWQIWNSPYRVRVIRGHPKFPSCVGGIWPPGYGSSIDSFLYFILLFESGCGGRILV
jgi:hypothetical protein